MAAAVKTAAHSCVILGSGHIGVMLRSLVLSKA